MADQHSQAEATWIKDNLRWNFTAMSLDYGLFSLALSIASSSTIMPAFAERLGAPNLVIGAIPAILTIGWQLPGLFSANYIERFPRKLPLMLFFTVWERLPFLFMGLLALLLAGSQPALSLVLFVIFIAMSSFTSGALNPAWMDLISRVMPANYRGRFFGFSSTLGGGIGILGTLASAYLLSSFPYPTSYGFCFLLAFGAMILSFTALAFTREGVLSHPKPSVSLATYLRRLPAILRRDPNYMWYLSSRALGALGAMGIGFYTVFALRVLQVPEVQVAAYTFALLSAQTVANLLLGFAADRYGHKKVLLVNALAVALSSLMGVFAHTTPSLLYVAFALFGVAYAAGNVSGLNISLDFAPPEDRPTYVGLSGTVLAPFAFMAPLIGGWLADAAGYEPVFWAAFAFSALGAAVLAVRVQDPGRRGMAASPASGGTWEG